MDSLINRLGSRVWQKLPPPVAALASHALSIGVGLLVALILHYILYRLGLPSKPFIYVVF